MFNFVPAIAQAFFHAAEAGDDARCSQLLELFYRPFAELRDRSKGFAVSLIKAGLVVTGRPMGGVRAPLLDPDPAQLEELRTIVNRAVAKVI